MSKTASILSEGLTLTETLARLGMTHEKALHDGRVRYRMGTRRILRDGAEVFVGTADDVWTWLREQAANS
jgi:hypothetical protein